MGTISVGGTLARALGFAFGRYFSILGAIWLPLLLFFATYYFAFAPLAGVFAAAVNHHASAPDLQKVLAADRWIPLVDLIVFVISVWLMVGVTKVALDMPRTFPFAYIGVGMDELRLLGAMIVFIALIYGAVFVIIIAGAMLAGVGAALVYGGATSAHLPLEEIAIGGAVLFGIALIFAIFYFAIRLMFFVAPVTVAEKRFGLWRSWELSRGHFWALFGIALCLFLMLLAVEIVLFALLAIPIAGLIAGAHSPNDILAAVRPALPFVGLGLFLVTPVLYGAQIGASVFAYKALTENSPG